MFEITENSILVVSKPNIFIKLFAYFFLPVGVLLLAVTIWVLSTGESISLQLIMTCLICLGFGVFAATLLKTRSYKFEKAAGTIEVGWGKDFQTFRFEDIKSLESITNVNWVTIRMLSQDNKYSSIYVFPHHEELRSEGKKLLNALRAVPKIEIKPADLPK